MSGQQRSKGPDEMFCRSCGEVIKEEAEICPHCGVRNQSGQASSGTPAGTGNRGHDPSQHETTVSDTWWYGVAGGTIIWAILIAVSASISGDLGALAGLVALVTWVGLPVAAYFDIQYVRANSRWNPNTVVWVILMAIWLVNIVAGAVYLYRRHEVLNVP